MYYSDTDSVLPNSCWMKIDSLTPDYGKLFYYLLCKIHILYQISYIGYKISNIGYKISDILI